MKKLLAPLGAMALLLSIAGASLAQTTSVNTVKSAIVGQDKMGKTPAKGKMPMKGKMTKKKMAKGKMAKGKMAKGKMMKKTPAKGTMKKM